MDLYEVPLSVFVGFWYRDYVRELPCVRYYVLRAVLNILVWNASPRGPMCFRCLILSLSGPCELLFFYFFYLLDLRSGECNVASLYVLCCPVNGSVCFVCCVFDNVCHLFHVWVYLLFGC